jgi:hypothetical protein
MLVKLDLGCGPNPKEGFVGIDRIKFPGVKKVVNLGVKPLPYKAGSVDEVHASHFLEHLTATQRCFLMNDLYRVMKPGAKATIIVPHWASSRAYGDPTHQWPPIGELWFFYLNREWRLKNAPHTDLAHWPNGYACDFDAVWGYIIHAQIQLRNLEQQQFAVNFYKEAAQDIHATLTRR